MIKHQYGFAVMNWNTGRDRCKSFWGTGTTEEECRADARRQANAYADRLSDEAYEKAKMKGRMRGDCYAPSRDSYRFGIVGCTLWKQLSENYMLNLIVFCMSTTNNNSNLKEKTNGYKK